MSLEAAQEYVREEDLTRDRHHGRSPHDLRHRPRRFIPGGGHLTYAAADGATRRQLDGLGAALDDHVLTATARDAVIAISFRPYNSDTARLFPDFLARGVPGVAVTDSLSARSSMGPASCSRSLTCRNTYCARWLHRCLVQSLAVGLSTRSISPHDRRSDHSHDATSDQMGGATCEATQITSMTASVPTPALDTTSTRSRTVPSHRCC